MARVGGWWFEDQGSELQKSVPQPRNTPSHDFSSGVAELHFKIQIWV